MSTASEKRTAELKDVMGEARTFAEFIQSFTQKHVIAFAILDPLLIFYAMATIESEWKCGVSLFGLATVLTCVFMWVAGQKKVAAVKAQAETK